MDFVRHLPSISRFAYPSLGSSLNFFLAFLSSSFVHVVVEPSYQHNFFHELSLASLLELIMAEKFIAIPNIRLAK